jgi:hypothetical protein
MVRFRLFSFLSFILLLNACGKRLPELKGIDRAQWIADPHACEGKRSKMIASLEMEKDKLLALNEMQVVEVLGKPDENELSKRNQKFYYYQLSPTLEFCNRADSIELKLIIRFNAMGLAKEVAIE